MPREAGAQALVEHIKIASPIGKMRKKSSGPESAEEISAQRVKMIGALENSLKQERQKARVLEERRLNEQKNQAEEEGIARGVELTGRLLACARVPNWRQGSSF